jgi:hypothetical protein
MKHIRVKILIFLSALFLAISSPLSAQSARDIMAEVDKVSKESSTSSVQKMKLSTCRYIVKQQGMHCTEEPRIKVIETILKDTGIDNRDSRFVSIILEPIRDKGIGLLTYNYDDPGKYADNWLYLSALGKVKRLISSSEDSDEGGSFFGTEFSIEDMESRKIGDYTYKILEQATYAERPVWIMESIPTPERARKTRYGKFISWIDRERYILLKEDLYNRNGKLYKQLTMGNIERIDSVWVARKITMNNLSARRVTLADLMSVAFNMDVPDEFLTQRTLTDFAFRERNLAKLRAYLK